MEKPGTNEGMRPTKWKIAVIAGTVVTTVVKYTPISAQPNHNEVMRTGGGLNGPFHQLLDPEFIASALNSNKISQQTQTHS